MNAAFYTDHFGDRVLRNGTISPNAKDTPTRFLAECNMAARGFPADQIVEARQYHQLYESALFDADAERKAPSAGGDV